MRKQLLISTAALLAGIGIASAQEMPAGKQSGGAQMEHGPAAQSREQGRGGQAQDLSKQGQSQQRQESQRQDKRDQTTGQAQRDQGKQSQHDQGMSQGKQSQGMPNEGMPGQQGKGKQSQTKQSQTKQSQTKQNQGKQGQAHQRQPQRDQTTGQGQRGQRDQTQGQRQQSQPSSQQSETRQGQTPQQGQAQQGQAQQGTQGAGGSVTLNSQQRTRIQQTVLASRNVPRVNNVNFALSVGTAVPSSVRIVDVPSALIEINPQWRGHQYFVVRDEIIIVDRSRKIVATVPVGSSGGAALHSRGGAASVAEVNLTEEQIRQIQIVLNEKGFNIGRPDGRLGPRTIRALTAFQRRQGLQASGRLDRRTVAALGVSNVSGAQGGAQGAGQSSTTGQGGAGSQRAPAQQNQGARQPSTSGQNGGQGGAAQQGAPSQHNEGASKPSTSGQGSSQQTPAQRNPGSGQRPANEQHENAGSK
jgi:peptidoglycan hydrolase-like protein with peptidoglycan-binding domain